MKERMAVAGCVLTSIQQHQTPSQADLAALQSWVGQKDAYADPDVLACIVIGAELQRRKEFREHVRAARSFA